MFKYIIEGGKSLKGSISISGAKNSALPILMASLLTDEKCILRNVPNLRDIQTTIRLLEALGKKVKFEKGVLSIEEEVSGLIEAPYDIVKTMRASICVLGPLLARYKKAKVSLPGGCAFGPRPVDLHLKGLSVLGANIHLTHGYIDATTDGLQGCMVNMLGNFGTTVLGTDNIMMGATLADGITKILYSALEPEVTDLAQCLIQMGANIEGIGTGTLKIEGIKKLNGFDYTVIPDRIEIGTFIAMVMATSGEINLIGAKSNLLELVIDISRKMGAKITSNDEGITVKSDGVINPVDIHTKPYPEFPTDLQPQFMACLMKAEGISTIADMVYPERFLHIPEFNRLGGDVKLQNATAIINGGKKTESTIVMASDIRAGAGLVIATLMTKGISEVHRIYHIERGYEKLEEKISTLGGIIRKEWEDN